jgi:diguanylate cyclase
MTANVQVHSSDSPKLAAGAFWPLMRRVVVIAAGVDVLFYALFRWMESPALAWINVVSVVIYAAAYHLLRRRKNALAMTLVWAEVLGHAAIGTVLVGWDSGFHYYLLMFIPAIVVSSSPRMAVTLVGLLLMCYLGLDVTQRTLGALQPLPPTGLMLVKWFNIVVVFLMFSAIGRLYVGMVARAEHRLHQLATRDPLTGLFNRRHFQAMADQVVAHARRVGEPVSLVIADVDFFKRVNDVHGHDAGDKVLTQFTEVLGRVFRAQDVLARWGGEEFVVLLPGTDAEGAAAAAERLRCAAEDATVPLPGHVLRFTVSVGYSALRPGEAIADALTRADRSLYAAKSSGRNRVHGEG